MAIVPDFRGMGVARALDAARAAGLRVEIDGSGLAVSQSLPPGPAPKPADCRIVFASGETVSP
jgi:hypothetical protein